MKKSKQVGEFDGFINDLIKDSGNELASIMEEETLSNTTEWLDTGSKALNSIISSSTCKGIPNNKIICFAGPESCGKSFIVLSIAKHAMENNGYIIIYFDSENSTEKEMILKRKMDAKKILYFPVDTVENFRTQCVKIVNKYNDTLENKKPKILIILDSLGNLSTKKETDDVESGSDKKDMTRAAVIKSTFRVLSLKLAKAKIPLLVTNHTYASVGSFIPTREMSGGSGIRYIASIIISMSKSKIKDDDKHTRGVALLCKTDKNRYCKEDSKVRIYLDFEKGLHPYYGLHELALENVSGSKYKMGDNTYTEKELLDFNLEWPKEILDDIEKKVHNKFAFGGSDTPNEIEDPKE
jgi:RecA/RadA recombinase